MGTTLVINPGSSSKKYALYENGDRQLDIRYEATNTGYEICTQLKSAQQICEPVLETDFSTAFSRIVEEVNGYLAKELVGKKLDAVVVRIVAPGTFFQKHAHIDDAYVKQLKERESSAPLHIPIILHEIRRVHKYFPGVPVVAASDSAFHSELPPRAREYSIPADDVSEFDVHRFGYHGLSVASVVRRVHPLIGLEPERMIVCHVGNGTSVTAVKNGKSVETTMGFSPSTGLPMGSRAGDLDAAALIELMRVKGMRPRDAEMYINTNGGLSGMAGDADIRRLLDRRCHNDAAACRALDAFVYNIQKAIAAQTVALAGLDVLVFTATAAVRSSELRTLITAGITHLGVSINDDRNDLLVGKEGVISTRNSHVKVLVMRTDEMGEMDHVVSQLDLQRG